MPMQRNDGLHYRDGPLARQARDLQVHPDQHGEEVRIARAELATTNKTPEEVGMQMISSAAGTRLAKAKARLKKVTELAKAGAKVANAHQVMEEYLEAADALSDELLDQGFHELDGV